MFPDSLMHQQRSQRNEGIQTIVAPGGRKMPQAWFSYLRRFLLCFAHPLFCFFWLFFFFFYRNPQKVQQKCSCVFLLYYSTVLPSPSPSHSTLILLFFPIPQLLLVFVPKCGC